MKASAILAAVSALFLSSAKAQMTITIPPLPDLPTVSIPTLTIPTSISLPSLPSISIPTSLPESVCFAMPTIPTSISVPTLMAAAPTVGPDNNTTHVLNDQFERMHPRQIAPIDA
ncbi:hypothetical protein BDW60DRAFT_207528 [Aspergillus nidulans var. acristatus]